MALFNRPKPDNTFSTQVISPDFSKGVIVAGHLKDDDRTMALDWTEGGLAEGLRRYRAGEFFAAHENWEEVWLGLEEPERTFLQSLIQVAAALHHLQRGNQQGTKSLLKAALRRLDPYPASFGGISVTRLCEELHECVQALEAGGELSELSFPRIRPDG